MLSTNRRIAISMVAVASTFAVHAAPAPPTDNGLESKDVDNDQQKDMINDLADEWASDIQDKSGDDGLPLDDLQDVSTLSADTAEHDEILDTDVEGEQLDPGFFISEEDNSIASELDSETQELEEIAKNINDGVHIEVEQAEKGDGQEVNVEIDETTGIEYDVAQESFDEAAIETESESNDADNSIWPEQDDPIEDVPDIKQVETEEEIAEMTWDAEPDFTMADPDPDAGNDRSTTENDELTEEETPVEDYSTAPAKDNIDEVTSSLEDPFAEINQSEDDIKLDNALTEEIDAEESNQVVDFGEEVPAEDLESPILDIDLSSSEELQESELEMDFAEYTSSETPETDEVYTATVDEDSAADTAEFFVDETTVDQPAMDTDTEGEIDSLLDSIQQSMDNADPASDDIPGSIQPADGLLKEAQISGDSNAPFSNAKGSDPFNPANQDSIGSLGDESSGFSLNLLLFFAIIVFLVFKSPKIKRFIFARESGSLPYHAVGRKNRD